MFGFLKRWRRHRVLARNKVADATWNDVLDRVPAVQTLAPRELKRLRKLVILFLHEKQLEGAGGFELTLEMQLAIAMQACLPILELGIDAYERFTSVYVYASAFSATEGAYAGERSGVITRDLRPRAGEALLGGGIALSWEDVDRGAARPDDGYNVVIHEFAHKLDMLDGAANGVPPLHRGQDAAAWKRDFQSAFEELCADVRHRRRPAIDAYGAESPAEFFAVASEFFFEKPARLRRELPKVYAHLRDFYKQDPRSRG